MYSSFSVLIFQKIMLTQNEKRVILNLTIVKLVS